MIWIISYEYEYILLESKIIFYRPIVNTKNKAKIQKNHLSSVVFTSMVLPKFVAVKLMTPSCAQYLQSIFLDDNAQIKDKE